MNTSTLAAPTELRNHSEAETAAIAMARETMAGGTLLGGYHIADPLKMVAAEAAGCRVRSMSGGWFIDHTVGAGALILGHTHPKVTQAIVDQARKGSHYFSFLNAPAVELAGEICDAVPCAQKITYTTTGSEATLYAIRIARAATRRRKILKFEGAYHGNHDQALVSMSPQRPADYPAGHPDSAGLAKEALRLVKVAPYNDLETTTRIVEADWQDMAAIIVSPMQRSIVPQPGFLEGLRALCDRHGMLLIFDEVVTGFRLSLGGGQQEFGVTPDLAALGKILGGGVGLGAVAGRAELLDLVGYESKAGDRFVYANGTFHGNPLAAAAGLAVLRELHRPGFYRSLEERGNHFRQEANAIFRRRGIPARVTGHASIWDLMFLPADPRNHADVMKADPALAREFDSRLIREGLFVVPGSRRFLCDAHTDADVEASLRAFDRVCAAIAAEGGLQ